MAIGIHVARVGFFAVSKTTGQVVSKDSKITSINDVLETEHQHRVIVDAAIANTANNPTVKRYLELEAASNYVLRHMDQNTIITYNQSQINSA